jgi:hypothetical protein
MREKIARLLLQLFGGSRRERRHVGRRPDGRSLDRRGLFNNQMRVCAAEAKRANGRSSQSVRWRFPFLQLGIDIERTGLEIDSGIAFLEMQRRRDLPVFQRQQEF